jgi:nucleoside-diphosphate-sugar epimerase
MDPIPYTHFWSEEPETQRRAWRPTDEVRRRLMRLWVIQALLLAATRPNVQGEVFLVTDGQAITRVRMMEIICEETGYADPARHVPRWLVRAACPVIEGFHALRRSREPPLVNKFRLKFMATPLTYRIDKARRLLGYEPQVDTETGLRQTLAWFRENHPELMPRH